jgi:hypothetical protein
MSTEKCAVDRLAIALHSAWLMDETDLLLTAMLLFTWLRARMGLEALFVLCSMSPCRVEES